jgi:protein TonB
MEQVLGSPTVVASGSSKPQRRSARSDDQLLRTGTVIVTDPVAAGATRRGLSVGSLSLAIHGVILVAAFVVPLMSREPLPEPAQGLRAFLVGPTDVALPPPPPPPPAPAAARAPRPAAARVPSSVAFTAPIEVPDEIAPEQGLDLGVPGGVAGGVEGGVPGGVVGGVVGGLPAAPPPPKARRVGGGIREPRKLRHVPPVYPDMALAAHVEGVVILECTVGPNGRVQEVEVLRSMPLLDEAAIEAVRQWIYSPTLLGGVPIPIIMTVTVQFSLQ